MDMQQLRLLVSVSQTLNFSETAKKYFITQPAVSHQIKALEQELDVVLLFRNGHNVRFTAEGLAFLEYAMSILDLENQARTVVRNLATGSAGHLRISSLPTLMEELELCLSRYTRKYPKIHVTVDQMEGGEFFKSYIEESYDFYFGSDRLFVTERNFEFVVTMKTGLKLFVNADIAPKIDINDPDTIKDLPFVSVNPSDPMITGQIEAVCEKMNFRPNIINYYNRIELVPLAVNAGIGLAILPSAVEYAYPYPNIRTFDIEIPESQINHMIVWKSLKSSAAVKFKSIVEEIYG